MVSWEGLAIAVVSGCMSIPFILWPWYSAVLWPPNPSSGVPQVHIKLHRFQPQRSRIGMQELKGTAPEFP